MPNWCENYCIIKHTEKSQLEELLAHCRGRETDLFAFIKPEPDYFVTPVAKWTITDEGEEPPEIRPDSWWHWRVINWGTRSEPEIHLAEVSKERGENVLYLSFDTAWSPPEGIYKSLAEKGFLVKAFYIESGMGFAGVWDDGRDECYSVFSLEQAEEVFPEELKEIFPPESYFYPDDEKRVAEDFD